MLKDIAATSRSRRRFHEADRVSHDLLVVKSDGDRVHRVPKRPLEDVLLG